MPQNVYDDPGFFAGYSAMARSVEGLDAAPEWPTLQSMLPPVAGARVVDLGCGFGWFSRWAAGAGAASVLGVDLSTNMLERARAFPVPPGVTYAEADLDRLALAPGSAELAFSSLTLHYLEDLPRFLGVVHDALVPGGAFVFSTEHPIFTAPSQAEFVDLPGGRAWPLDCYFDEGPFESDWLAEGVVKEHRTTATILNALIDTGLVLDRVEEWSPSPRQVHERPDWADDRQRPYFLLVAVHRP